MPWPANCWNWRRLASNSPDFISELAADNALTWVQFSQPMPRATARPYRSETNACATQASERTPPPHP